MVDAAQREWNRWRETAMLRRLGWDAPATTTAAFMEELERKMLEAGPRMVETVNPDLLEVP